MGRKNIVNVNRTGMSLLLGVWLAAPAAIASDTALRGQVRSQEGRAVEGVVVSARSQGKTVTTTVFTDEDGRYLFPPLEKGRYRLWAQAVGFATARTELTLDGVQEATHDFALNTLPDFTRQLSSSEFMGALPEDTPANRRLKMLFRNNCAGCHQPSFVLQNRFDEDGWRKIITMMERVGIYGDPPRVDQAPMPLLRYFKDEIAAYLARMRGPASPLKYHPLPRPRGEPAQVVITEYEINSSLDTNQPVTQDGSDWMEGTPSAYEARGPHDAEVDASGFVWIADSQDNPVRTVARLDPATGAVKNFKLEGRHGMAMRSHGIVIDPNSGIGWFNADGGLGKIDTRTEKLEWFDPPQGMARAGGTLDVDGHSIVWISTNDGALAFDPATQKFKEFKSISRGNDGRTYGVAVDADGNGWWAQMNYDKMGVGNYRTGEISEVALQRRPGMDEVITDRDRKIYDFVGADWNAAPPWHQGPRRLSADKKGDTVWVANWWGGNMAKIDIKTHKVTYYPHPRPGEFAGVYDTVVDKNGMVWTNLMHADRVARFDPKTEQWTEFVLPTRGTETRFIAVDNFKKQVEVWVPYWRTSKMARIQFRDKEQLRAQR